MAMLHSRLLQEVASSICHIVHINHSLYITYMYCKCYVVKIQIPIKFGGFFCRAGSTLTTSIIFPKLYGVILGYLLLSSNCIIRFLEAFLNTAKCVGNHAGD